MEMAFYQRNTVTIARMTAYMGGPNENKTIKTTNPLQ